MIIRKKYPYQCLDLDQTQPKNHFDEEAAGLPFYFNINKAIFPKEQQDQLCNMLYGHHQVFFLQDED